LERDEDMADAGNLGAGRDGALSLANGAGPAHHDDEEEEPENAVVLHEVRPACERAQPGPCLAAVSPHKRGRQPWQCGRRPLPLRWHRGGASALQSQASSVHGCNRGALRAQDKKYYPTAEETFGKETETLVMEEDAQPLEVLPALPHEWR